MLFYAQLPSSVLLRLVGSSGGECSTLPARARSPATQPSAFRQSCIAVAAVGGLAEGHSDLIETMHHVAGGIQTGDGCRHVLINNQGSVRRVVRVKGQGEI